MTAYYNEIEPFAAAWLRELIKAGHIAPGDVDERSIEDVKPTELVGYTQCHFFAGVGVWSYALRQSGWPDDRKVWTGSCPCQPFSAAGKRSGVADERHLWPAMHWLIQQCKPPVVFGEQVASPEIFGSKLEIDFAVAVRAGDTVKANRLAKKLVRQKGFTFHPRWIDLVHADLAGLGYAFGYRAFPAAGVGAPHIRDRAYWVADSEGERRNWRQDSPKQTGRVSAEAGRSDGGLGNSHSELTRGNSGAGDIAQKELSMRQLGHLSGSSSSDDRPAPTNGFWRDPDWLGCRDEKWRPVEPGLKPLVDGPAARVGRLRGYGNAINAEAAKAFIESFMIG